MPARHRTGFDGGDFSSFAVHFRREFPGRCDEVRIGDRPGTREIGIREHRTDPAVLGINPLDPSAVSRVVVVVRPAAHCTTGGGRGHGQGNGQQKSGGAMAADCHVVTP